MKIEKNYSSKSDNLFISPMETESKHIHMETDTNNLVNLVNTTNVVNTVDTTPTAESKSSDTTLNTPTHKPNESMEQLYLNFALEKLEWENVEVIVNLSNRYDYELLFKAMRFYRLKQYGNAIRLLEESVERGNSYAMNLLGYIYITKLKDSPNEAVNKDVNNEGLTLLERSIELNNPFAMNNLGCMYIRGKYIKKDVAKGIALLQRSIGLGNALAIHNLGVHYYDSGNKPLGWKLLKESVEMGVPIGDFKVLNCVLYTALALMGMGIVVSGYYGFKLLHQLYSGF